MKIFVVSLSALMAMSLLAAEESLTALKDGAAFSLDDVPGEIVVERRKGVPLRFSMAENMTTGYRWDVEWNTNECTVVLDHRGPDTRDGSCGAPGRVEVSILSKIYTPARVEFRYARPWEKGVAPFKSLKVIVYTVGEAKAPLYPRNAVNRLLAAECASTLPIRCASWTSRSRFCRIRPACRSRSLASTIGFGRRSGCAP